MFFAFSSFLNKYVSRRHVLVVKTFQNFMCFKDDFEKVHIWSEEKRIKNHYNFSGIE